MKKRIIHALTLSEISAVDDPAQEGATAVLMKRNEKTNQETDMTIEQRLADLEKAKIEQDTVITGLKTELEKAKADKTAAEAAVEKAKKEAELTVTEKKHYGSLDDKAKGEFLAKSKGDRQAVIDNLASQDPVVYKSKTTGAEYKKSQSELAALAKQNDETHAELAKMRETNADAELTKRAETELQYLPGDVEVRKALIKATDSIENEELRKKAQDALKAQNAALSKSFETLGAAGNPQVTKNRVEAEEKLDKLTDDLHKSKGGDRTALYTQVCEQNPQLYKLATGE